MRTLVLNAGYEPLAVVSFKRAIVLVMNEKAVVVEHVDGEPVWAARGSYDRPAVILLTRYVRVPGGRHIPVTRRGVLRRDAHRCGYCGKAASTIDHILPRSRGGADSWENLVACCLRCNNVKGDRTPQEMSWELRIDSASAPGRAVDGAGHRSHRPVLGALPGARGVGALRVEAGDLAEAWGLPPGRTNPRSQRVGRRLTRRPAPEATARAAVPAVRRPPGRSRRSAGARSRCAPRRRHR